MLHTKLLMQRLACMSWLLAAGLAWGWIGEAEAQTLTARFEMVPESHDGSEFTFEIHFSEEIEMSFVNMRDDVLDVTGGAATGARRLTQGSNIGWQITIVPDLDADVSISLPPTVDCEAASAVCTADDRALSSGIAALVLGLPIPPTNVVATLVNGVLSVNWEQTGANQNQNTYRVKYREQGTTDWQPVAYEERRLRDENNNEITYADGAGTTVSYEVTGLNSDATYEVQVRSAKSGFISEWAPEPPVLAITVSSTEIIEDTDEEPEISAQQTVQADLELSVNPARVREDAGETAIEVTVAVTDDTAVETDTYVLLTISTEGLNTRYLIGLTTLRIPAGETKATGTLTFIPINDEIIDDDLAIEISGYAGGGKTVESATITLIDDDKDSQNIDLSVDIAELTRFDDATEITVTATLDGKVLNEATSFALIVGDHPDLTSDPNTDTDGDGDVDAADATKDNREAQRDVDYTVTLGRLTIPRKAVSGTTTITLTPRNQLPGTVRIASPDFDLDADAPGIQIADDGLTLNPVDLAIKKEVTATADAIALSQERIREDAGETTIELTVTLTEASVEDQTVDLSVLPAGATLPSGDTVTATPLRDVHYTLAFGPTLTIPAGATDGTTMFTLTPRDDTDAVQRGAIYIQIRVGSLLATRTIVLADDDTSSMNITLTAEPTSISEGAGTTAVTVTGTLDGKVFDNNVVMFLTIDPNPQDTDADGNVVDVAAAVRDIDYSATVRPLVILAGSVSGKTTVIITPVDDKRVETDETIRLTVPYPNKQITARDADGDDFKVTVSSVDITLKDTGAGGAPSFAEDAVIADQTYVEGTAIADWVLPEASDGDGDLTYSISTLPAGLEFDVDTRTLAGTPTEATDGAVAITYTAMDADGDTDALTFSITIAAEGTLPVFATGAAIAAQMYTVGTAIADWVLPAASGGDGELTYSVSTLPAGLEFDAATRTLGGTPTAATDSTLAITYTVTDANSATATLVFTITVNPAPVSEAVAAGLTAVPAAIREDAAATAISLTFTLADTASVDENVRFAIVDPSAGTEAIRDVDYTAALEALITIPAGAIEGTATLTITPINDNTEEGLKALGVRATLISTGAALLTDIEIRDDETPSTAIELSADPSTVDESAGLTTVTVTATLDGKALDEDATIRLVIDEPSSTATRDLDYGALFTPMIEIEAGSITGEVKFHVIPVVDNLVEDDEIIRLVGTIDGLEGDEVEITLTDPAAAKAVAQTLPESFELANNYPNPFNPTTTIQYALPQAADVELTVYNVFGQVVRTLVAEYQSAGRYAVEWDATNDSGYRLSSGMYLYRLQAGGEFLEVKKMLLLR